MTREELDSAMRDALAQLETCSHVPAAGYQPTGRSPRSDEPQGGHRPPGDTGHTPFAQAYGPPFHAPSKRHPGARNDRDRERIIEWARAELEHLRGHAERARPAGESAEQTVKRMLTEYRGWSPELIEQSSLRMSARTVRKHRKAGGLDPENGQPPVPEPQPDRDARRRRARELRAKGMPLSSIAMTLGVDKATVHRDLEERAA